MMCRSATGSSRQVRLGSASLAALRARVRELRCGLLLVPGATALALALLAVAVTEIERTTEFRFRVGPGARSHQQATCHPARVQ